MRSNLAVRAAIGVLVIGAGSLASGQTVTLNPSADATLFQDVAGAAASGAGVEFYAGVTNGRGIRRALLRFDLSSIPAGSQITSVALTLTGDRGSPTSTGAIPFSLHRVTNSWGEGTSAAPTPGGGGVPATPGDATWLHRSWNTVLWNTPGGDFVETASATQNLPRTGSFTWSGAGMVADVQSWLDGGAGNFGWLLRSVDEVNGGSAHRFESREGNASQRPRLVVNYIPAPGWAGLALAGGVLASRRRRRAV